MTTVPQHDRRRRLRLHENWYRDVWLTLISAAVVLMASAVLGTVKSQQRGRADAIRITCAILTAITQAGREVIAAPATTPETPFARQLERLGYPPPAVRRRQAQAAANAYARSINLHVVSAVGAHKARGVVLASGQIDCQRLLSVSKATGR